MNSLVEELNPSAPATCAYCKRSATWPKRLAPLVVTYYFRIFEECDESDQPNGKFLVLCEPCGDGHLIDNHERLYAERSFIAGDVCPGVMPQCSSCQFRNGAECIHPARWDGGLYFGEAPTLEAVSGIDWSSRPDVLSPNSPADWRTCMSRLGVMEHDLGRVSA